jgi:DNA-binding NarL/FixJ family response regulator
MLDKSGDDSIPPRDGAELRARTMERDTHVVEHAGLADLWNELVSGCATVVEEFFTKERCGLLLQRDPERKREPIVGRRLLVLELLMTGSCQKNIALDLDVAPSTVAIHAQRALRHLGASSRPSRVHPTLMLMAMAARGLRMPMVAVRARLGEDSNLELIGMPRPDSGMASILPHAQLAVTRHLVEGDCYKKISVERGTSQRTIANQIAAVFRRLNVSGRSELLQRLISWPSSVDIDSPSSQGAVHV